MPESALLTILFSTLNLERQRAEEAEKRADRLAAKLRELGIDPDTAD